METPSIHVENEDEYSHIAFVKYVAILWGIFVSLVIFSFFQLKSENLSELSSKAKSEAFTIITIVENELKNFLGAGVSINSSRNLQEISCGTVNEEVEVSFDILKISHHDKCLQFDLHNLKRTILELLAKEYIYSVYLASKLVVTNNFDDQNIEYSFKKEVLDGTYLTVGLSFNSDSEYLSYSTSNLHTRIGLVIAIASLFTIISTVLLYFWYVERVEQIASVLKTHNIQKTFDKEKSYIIDCYKFSLKKNFKSAHEGYLPIPVIDSAAESELTKVRITELILYLEELFGSFRELRSENHTQIEYETNNIEYLDTPFDQMILIQILVSVLYNLLNFNSKIQDNRYIKVDFYEYKIVIIASGLKLNGEMAINASEKIFFDTANPFVLKFSQVVGLMDHYDLSLEVDYNEYGTSLGISFPKTETIPKGKIMAFKRRKG